MKRITLTDQQYALLHTFFHSEAFASDQVQDALSEAAREILGHPEERDDDLIELEINLQNDMSEAVCSGVDVEEPTEELISYCHSDAPGGTRFVQRKVDAVPSWAVDVQPYTQPKD